jgi:uncharacterized phage protein gp47/JayE
VIGALLPTGSPLSRQGDGYPYITTADAFVLGDLSLTAPARAVVDPSDPQGAAGNCDAGAVLQIGTAVAGINTNGQAQTAFTGGADVELDDSFRQRVLAAFAKPAQGGDLADYIAWARAVPGVTRAWVKPHGMGSGSVVIYFMEDEAEIVHGGFPRV